MKQEHQNYRGELIMSDLVRTMYTIRHGKYFKGCHSAYWDVEFHLQDLFDQDPKYLDSITISVSRFNLTKKSKESLANYIPAKEFLDNPKVFEV